MHIIHREAAESSDGTGITDSDNRSNFGHHSIGKAGNITAQKLHNRLNLAVKHLVHAAEYLWFRRTAASSIHTVDKQYLGSRLSCSDSSRKTGNTGSGNNAVIFTHKKPLLVFLNFFIEYISCRFLKYKSPFVLLEKFSCHF